MPRGEGIVSIQLESVGPATPLTRNALPQAKATKADGLLSLAYLFELLYSSAYYL